VAGFRGLFVLIVLALAQPALAVEFWAPADCEVYMLDPVRNLEEFVEEIEETRVLLDEAQRKGETELVANLETVLESKRVDGIQSVLKRIDTVEYVYCDKTLFDPALIARVDAVRPWAEGTETAAAVEEAPKIVVSGISTAFVPYAMLDGGGCKGPFLDLGVTIVNRGGVYPRAVDVEKRTREYPGVDWTTKPLLSPRCSSISATAAATRRSRSRYPGAIFPAAPSRAARR
jgi:hypothetical protein